jgi:hypothetical protein
VLFGVALACFGIGIWVMFSSAPDSHEIGSAIAIAIGCIASIIGLAVTNYGNPNRLWQATALVVGCILLLSVEQVFKQRAPDASGPIRGVLFWGSQALLVAGLVWGIIAFLLKGRVPKRQ